MSWLAPLFSGGVLLAPGLLKFTLVNPSGKPHEHALAGPLRFRLKWFFASLLVVIVLLAFASWPAHSQGILVLRGAVLHQMLQELHDTSSSGQKAQHSGGQDSNLRDR